MTDRQKALTAAVIAMAVLISIFSAITGYKIGKRDREVIVERDTVTSIITIRDTITQYQPKYITKTEIRKELVYLVDTIRVHDSLYVSLPVEKRVYEDTDYRAVVTGIRPELESITVYPETKVVTQTITVHDKVKPKPWGIGVQVGFGGQYGLTSKRVDYGPYIGVGVSYNFIRF